MSSTATLLIVWKRIPAARPPGPLSNALPAWPPAQPPIAQSTSEARIQPSQSW